MTIAGLWLRCLLAAAALALALALGAGNMGATALLWFSSSFVGAGILLVLTAQRCEGLGALVAAAALPSLGLTAIVHVTAHVRAGTHGAAWLLGAASLFAVSSGAIELPDPRKLLNHPRAVMCLGTLAVGVAALAAILSLLEARKLGVLVQPAEALRLVLPLLLAALPQVYGPLTWGLVAVAPAVVSLLRHSGVGEAAWWGAGFLLGSWTLGRFGRAAGLVVLVSVGLAVGVGVALEQEAIDSYRVAVWNEPVGKDCLSRINSKGDRSQDAGQTQIREAALTGASLMRFEPDAPARLALRRADDEIFASLLGSFGVAPLALALALMLSLPLALLRAGGRLAPATGATLGVAWIFGLMAQSGVIPFTGITLPLVAHGGLATACTWVAICLAVAEQRHAQASSAEAEARDNEGQDLAKPGPPAGSDPIRARLLGYVLVSCVASILAFATWSAYAFDASDQIHLCEATEPRFRPGGALRHMAPTAIVDAEGAPTDSELARYAIGRRGARASQVDLAWLESNRLTRFVEDAAPPTRDLQTFEEPAFRKAADAITSTLRSPSALVVLDADRSVVIAAASHFAVEGASLVSPAAQGLFDTGSTLKVLAAAAAASDPPCTCQGGIEAKDGHIRCSAAHGHVTPSRMLKVSCNACAVHYAQSHPSEMQHMMAAAGLEYDPARPSKGLLGAATTPVRLAALYAAIDASDGALRLPRWSEADAAPSPVALFDAGARAVLQAGTAAALGPGGTAHRLPDRIGRFSLAGAKTGSAILPGWDRGTLVVRAVERLGQNKTRRLVIVLTTPIKSTAGAELTPVVKSLLTEIEAAKSR